MQSVKQHLSLAETQRVHSKTVHLFSAGPSYTFSISSGRFTAIATGYCYFLLASHSPPERGPGVIAFMILSRHTFKMQKLVPVRFFPCTCDICSDPQCRDSSGSQVTWDASFLTKICLQAFSSLFHHRQMDVYGRFQICTVSSISSFMSVCSFLIDKWDVVNNPYFMHV